MYFFIKFFKNKNILFKKRFSVNAEINDILHFL